MIKLKGLRQIQPYVAGQQPQESNMIKLNTNENAYGPSPKVAEALRSFDAHELRRYSSLDQAALSQALAVNLGVSPDQLIISTMCLLGKYRWQRILRCGRPIIWEEMVVLS